MNNLQVFNFNQAQVRIVERDGHPWFVASDVCTVLEISNPSDAMKRLDDDERTLVSIEGASNGLPVNAVNEYGLYNLVLGSRKPEAKEFKRWVTHEVIPSIRKTGHYGAPQLTSAEMIAAIANQAVEQERRMKALETHITETVTTIQETFLQRDEDWRKSINKMLNGAAYRMDGGYRDLRSRSYSTLEERARCDLDKRLRNLVERLEAAGATKTQLRNTSRMDVIENEPRLKEIYTSIVKELSIGTLQAVTR